MCLFWKNGIYKYIVYYQCLGKLVLLTRIDDESIFCQNSDKTGDLGALRRTCRYLAIVLTRQDTCLVAWMVRVVPSPHWSVFEYLISKLINVSWTEMCCTWIFFERISHWESQFPKTLIRRDKPGLKKLGINCVVGFVVCQIQLLNHLI